MRALAVTGRGAQPAVVDIPERAPGPGEVTVAVGAASINGFDVVVAAGYGWDSMPHAFPVVMGRDFAGTVAEAGEGAGGLTAGDPVAG